jgi:hypothetical protein
MVLKKYENKIYFAFLATNACDIHLLKDGF